MKKNYILLVSSLLLLFLSACNRDDVVSKDVPQKPIIEIDSENGIYTTKVGREVTIQPTFKFSEDAIITWTIDGKLVSKEKTFSYTWQEVGEYYVKISVANAQGTAVEELKVEVLDLTPPVVSLVLPSLGLKVLQDTEYTFTPDIQHSDLEGFKIEWIIDDVVVSSDKSYTFKEHDLGDYTITIKASNIDGETTREVNLEVVDTMPYKVSFPAQSFQQTSTDRYSFVGRPVLLRPNLEYFEHPVFVWSVNNEVVPEANERTFKFTPKKTGVYIIDVVVSEGTSTRVEVTRNLSRASSSEIKASVKVTCVSDREEDLFREASASSSRLWNKVYEYTPAPGQFIGETKAQFTGNETTPEAAIGYATKRLENRYYVSLGSFGGYIVVGFDHSIKNSKANYDFAIEGNAFDSSYGGGSNEAGIVWVMQDVNGNGLPDDEWYELRGSETGKEETFQNYAVTYYMPESKNSIVHWTDDRGNNGWIDYLSSYHWQDSYYPTWIKDKSYTLYGTRLASRNKLDPKTGYWGNYPYDWGYVDNMGSDNLKGGNSVDGSGQRNGFKISNAMYSDGTPINLEYIDFIKVQCGILAKSGVLGELSTEVFSFEDLSITK